MKVAKTEKISPGNMVKLYKSLVMPHLEYAAPVWQCSSRVQCCNAALMSRYWKMYREKDSVYA
ncbi:hypothetical protein DPMN_170339 [Dreissena polymorpha]|uniref:Uncharacterized protein n=1 Tax=Dreissena polymorpha TaxID=45954 RepID=A0A9D4DVZ9_DREPO|nr:hypothetical protein DPMN_170339 [Dreissena polymorpha]